MNPKPFLLAMLLVACETGPSGPTGAPASREEEEEDILVPPEPPTSPVTAEQLLVPRGAAPLEAYVGIEVTLRLFGIETGDGTRRASAVFADTSTWVTRAYEEGSHLGRGARVEAVDRESVRIRTARGELLEVRPGEDARVRWVRHVDDRVVRSLGRHRYVFFPRAARATPDDGSMTPPALELVELHGRRAARLPPLQEGTRLAAAGFREGDLLVDVNGVAAGSDVHVVLREALANDAAFRVRIFRSGVPVVLRFVPDR